MNRLSLPKVSLDLSKAVWALALRGRFMFTFLVAGLAALSIGVWWSVQTAVDADVSSRLNSEAARIETTFSNRLESYANSLVDLRGRFIVDGVPSEDEFKRFMATLEISKRVPGVKTIGFNEVEARGDEFAAPVRLQDPSGWQNEAALRFDSLKEPIRHRAILSSIMSGEATLSDQVTLITDLSVQGRGFLIYLPVYKSTTKPLFVTPTEQELLGSAKGVIYAAIRSSDLFEAAFGQPSLNKETVNFSLSLADKEQPIYNRFDLGPKGPHSLMAVRKPALLGRRFNLVVTPLNQFYTSSDRYLPLGVGFGAAFISILVLLVLKSSQIQLLYETRAKELSVFAMQKSRTQTERLKRLNESARTLSAELDLDALVNKFFSLATQLCFSQRSFLYFAANEGRTIDDDHEPLLLRGHEGFPRPSDLPLSMERGDFHALMNGKAVRRRTQNIETPKPFAVSLVGCSDWLLIELSSRSLGLCAVLLLSRTDGSQFEEVEVELIESFVAQATGALDNAQLFRKVGDASRAKNAFLANMSHEIRTPLNAIVGFSEILVDGKLTSAQREGLAESIRKGGQQLSRIVDDILDLSKVEAGKLLVDRKNIELRAILKEIRSIVELRLGARPLKFHIESEGRVPAQIETDEVRLKQILLNLIGNAIKFTEEGHVKLRLRLVEGVEKSGSRENHLAFQVEDTGMGIASEAQDQLFQPFSQGDDSKTRRFGGSGLGLALSRRLSEQLGGNLTLVKSEPDRGSVFEARVLIGTIEGATWLESHHLQAEAAPIETPATDSAGGLEGTHLLLVEDSIDNQEIFCYFLEEAGAKVTVVADGLKAVEIAGSGSFDLILMDIQIPEIDGKEATRRIRRQGFKKPIVALTAHAMADERESCLRAGCVGQITKPVSGTELISEIKRYLRLSPERVDGSSTENFA